MNSDFELHQSSMKSFMMCPRRFQYEYIEKIPTPTNSASYLGSAFHFAVTEALAAMQKENRDVELDWITQLFNEEMDSGDSYSRLSHKWNGYINWGDDTLDECKAIGRDMLEKAYPHIKALKPVMIETYLQANTAGYKCGGRIDVYDSERGLIDFKTAARDWPKSRIQDNLQLTFYAMLLGGPTKCEMHIATRSGKYTVGKTVRNQAQINYLVYDIIVPVMQQIEFGSFPCCDTESWWCSDKWCNFYNRCGRSRYD